MDTKLSQLIDGAKNIAIFSHVTPDADALCSAFALKNIIKNNYDFKNVDVFVDGEIGDLYAPILRDEVLNLDPLNNYDIAFILDCPTIQRIGKYSEMARDIPTIINIDHHDTNSKFGELNYVSPSVSSTCEIVYLIAKGMKLELNNQIAKEIYQGIITDTNCFDSIKITPRTQRVVSELTTKYKFNASKIEAHYFQNNSALKSTLFRKAVQSMRFYSNGRVVSMHIPNNVIVDSGATFEDTLGIIDNIMKLINANIGTIIIEKAQNYNHCSLRSKNGILNVGEIAKMFDGGGSENMAAFQKYGKFDEIEDFLISTIINYLPIETTIEQSDEFENEFN